MISPESIEDYCQLGLAGLRTPETCHAIYSSRTGTRSPGTSCRERRVGQDVDPGQRSLSRVPEQASGDRTWRLRLAEGEEEWERPGDGGTTAMW